MTDWGLVPHTSSPGVSGFGLMQYLAYEGSRLQQHASQVEAVAIGTLTEDTAPWPGRLLCWNTLEVTAVVSSLVEFCTSNWFSSWEVLIEKQWWKTKLWRDRNWLTHLLHFSSLNISLCLFLHCIRWGCCAYPCEEIQALRANGGKCDLLATLTDPVDNIIMPHVYDEFLIHSQQQLSFLYTQQLCWAVRVHLTQCMNCEQTGRWHKTRWISVQLDMTDSIN